MFVQHSLASVFHKQESIYNPFPQSGPSGSSLKVVPQYSLPVRFNPVVGFSLAALFTVCFFMGSLCVYVKRYCAQRRRRRSTLPVISTVVGASPPLLRHEGLDKETIHSLPVVAFSPQMCSKEGKSPTECSVCLSEFRSDESLKCLPTCSHFFHPECIDMWLLSHSTCPLCRSVLVSRKSWSEPAVHERLSPPLAAPGEVAITILEDEVPGEEQQAGVSDPRREQDSSSVLLLLSPVKEDSVSRISSKVVRTYLHRSNSSPLMAAERPGESPDRECTVGDNESLTRCGGLRRTSSIPALAFQSL